MKVYLVSKPSINIQGLCNFFEEEFPQVWRWTKENEAEQICEIAGRFCYMSFQTPRPGGRKEYFKRILESGHGSVLEHANFGFIVKDISRACSHELVRHRAGFAFSQLSQRYVSALAPFIVPEALTDSETYKEMIKNAEDNYHLLLEELEKKCPHELTGTDRKKWIRQQARYILPNATETKIFVTANIRAWRHFLELRGSRHADIEIRNLAIEIFKILILECPIIFDDFKITEEGELISEHRKV